MSISSSDQSADICSLSDSTTFLIPGTYMRNFILRAGSQDYPNAGPMPLRKSGVRAKKNIFSVSQLVQRPWPLSKIPFHDDIKGRSRWRMINHIINWTSMAEYNFSRFVIKLN